MVNICFLDTSAVVKRYVDEVGSAWIHGITASEMITVSRITWVEVLSAFSRLKREGKTDPGDILTAIRIFQYDWETIYRIVEIDLNVIEKAGQLVQKHPLRAYDSIQLASALGLHLFFSQADPKIFTFVSADNRLIIDVCK
jgi:uncharacterized protein